MNVNVLRKFKNPNGASQIHFKRFGEYYLASDNGREVVIFKSNNKGEIVDFSGIYDFWTFDVIDHLF